MGYGMIFTDIALAVFLLMLAIIVYKVYNKMAQSIEVSMDTDIKYHLIEDIQLDKYAEKLGINLNKEMQKREIFKTKRKNLKKKIEDEIFNEMFPEKVDKKEGVKGK